MAKEKKEVKTVDLRYLSLMAAETAAIQSEVMDAGGVQLSYINLLSRASAVTTKGDPAYIKGANLGSFVIPSKGILLGEEFTAVITGVFSLYDECIPQEPTPEQRKKGEKPADKIVSVWMPEDAANVPVDGPFNRPFINAKDRTQHILKPTHRMYLYLPDHPEITDAVLTFRSTGNSFCQGIKKLLARESTVSTELRLKFSSVAEKNETYNSVTYYPVAVVDGRNYILKDGEIELVKGGMKEEELETVITLSSEQHLEYKNHKMVSLKRNLAEILDAAPAKKAIAASSVEYDDEEEEEEPTPRKGKKAPPKF